MASSNFSELLEIKKPLFDTFLYVIYRLSQTRKSHLRSGAVPFKFGGAPSPGVKRWQLFSLVEVFFLAFDPIPWPSCLLKLWIFK